MSDETTEKPQPARPARPAKPSPSPIPPNARRTPAPRAAPPPRAPPPPPREGTRERHFYDREREGKPVPLWKDRAAAAMNRWPKGAEVKREDYDAAIERAGQITVR